MAHLNSFSDLAAVLSANGTVGSVTRDMVEGLLRALQNPGRLQRIAGHFGPYDRATMSHPKGQDAMVVVVEDPDSVKWERKTFVFTVVAVKEWLRSILSAVEAEDDQKPFQRPLTNNLWCLQLSTIGGSPGFLSPWELRAYRTHTRADIRAFGRRMYLKAKDGTLARTAYPILRTSDEVKAEVLNFLRAYRRAKATEPLWWHREADTLFPPRARALLV